jgi:phospholipid/cholesterol/gamma-HCH transport system substrate-binding protein
MESEAKYTLVGAAVLVLLAAIVAAFVWLRATGEGRHDIPYKIYFERQSLEGLQPRSPVKMRGIQVGVVTGFVFSPRVPGAVEVMISVEPTTPVRQSTRAVVDRHLVTGIASVRLENVTEESPPLVQAPPGEPFPVIAEGETPLEQFSETATQIAQRADETMRRLNATLSDENLAALGDTLQNLRKLSQDAQQVVTQVEGALGAVGRAADEVRGLSGAAAEQMRGLADDMRGLAREVTEDTRRLASRYDKVGEDASGAMREIAGAVRQMSADAAQLANRVGALVTSGDVELRSTAQEVRAAAEAFADAARQLGDPRAALFGPAPGSLGPGEANR